MSLNLQSPEWPSLPAAVRDVVILSSIDWARNWQTHQQLATSLVDAGHRVLFIENTGVRPPRRGDYQRVVNRIRNWVRSTRGFHDVRENLTVFSPLFLPLPYSRWALAINKRLLSTALRRWMRASGCHEPLVITFLPTPLADALIEAIEPIASIYYCANDMAGGSSGAAPLRSFEQQFMARVDAVFCNSHALMDVARQTARRCELFPAAVDFDRFASRPEEPPPAELQRLSGPLAGYVGTVGQVFDEPLMLALATRMPHVQFVLVGPVERDVTALTALSNVHVLGPRPHADIPGILHALDVGLIPYVVNSFTDAVYSCKLNEYLAAGLPVVATPIREWRHLREVHGDVVQLVDTPDSAVAALQAALTDHTEPRVAERQAVARRNSWPQRFTDMMAVVREVVAAKRSRSSNWQWRLRQMLKAGQRRVLKGCIAALLVYGVLVYSPLLPWVASPLLTVNAPHPAQALVVFSGDGDPGYANMGYQRRAQEARALFVQGWAPRVIVSSGKGRAMSEARVVKALLVDQGVPAAVITALDATPNGTHAHVASVARVLRAQGCNSVLLVTGPYHARRAALVWHRVAPDIDVTVVRAGGLLPTDADDQPKFKIASLVAYEYTVLAYYWWNDWI
jgi:glycosyltransferase involved in cell wall biosynthesis/uncharacterized SAM-binding protein YcdF (DUF218 family)